MSSLFFNVGSEVFFVCAMSNQGDADLSQQNLLEINLSIQSIYDIKFQVCSEGDDLDM